MSKKKTPFFDPVDTGVSFVALERRILERWYELGIDKKYREKNASSDKYFSFLDGPITANNPMGVHHAWGRTYKDLWQRYKNLKGFKQRFQNGFDCQGLWVEVEVEKELGLKSKREIENLVPGDKKASLSKFIELCKERVYKYSKIQTEQSKRLGYFMDWDNSYYTLSDNNNYMIWHFLKKCHERGLVYKGTDSVPWCPRCGTAISQHEMLTEDYKEVTHDSVFFELPVVGRENEYLLVWTTTPWTIPANIVVAVNSKLEYCLVEGTTGDKFWIANDAIERVFGDDFKSVVKKILGKELVGLSYRAPFDELPRVKAVAEQKNFHSVIATDEQILPVSVSEGTGLVHIATGAGTEDYKLGKVRDLPVLPVIEEDASYMEGMDFLTGKNAKKHPELILDFLKKDDGKLRNWIFEIRKITHRYPACWRCKTELVWRVVDEWYILMDKPYSDNTTLTFREEMKRVVKEISWIPGFGLKRELDWLSNMDDWLISKKRYWGLALPIWECSECEKFEVIGGKEELKERAVSGFEEFEGNSPHRPWVDEVKIKCECGGEMSRIFDVGNPWLDAGIVPFSTIAKDNQGEPLYSLDKKEWEKWFPIDFITESFPGQFKNWFYSLIAMSTMLSETHPFKTVLGFGTLLAEDGRPMHKSWGNSIEFNDGADKIGADVMRWMYARQNPADNMLFGYKNGDETRRRFHLKLWNIYNFFVTYANLDNFVPDKNGLDKCPVVSGILDLWILERFWEMITSTEKHLDKFDAFGATDEIERFVEDLSNWYVRRSRDRVGPWIEDGDDKREFYQTLYFILVNLTRIISLFVPFVADEMYMNLTKEESVHLSSWPKSMNNKSEKLVDEMRTLREIVEVGHAERKKLGIAVRQPLSLITIKSPALVSDEILFLLKEELNVKECRQEKAGETSVLYDTKISKELEEEAKVREMARKIQMERRNMNVLVSDKVDVVSEWLPKTKGLIEWMKKRLGIRNLTKGEFKVQQVSK
ncbi:isoleucine--tRNA ligase [Candidatus Woesebacteria bacterium RIFOXYB1_FULL_38_16]|uniref:Isoleucine--tRNA ligase n=1 Tax=Candidatus Woesebacteria bacterium RIFOXYB1_FULL_38_16 TaxID=1802538 RepID=A0A1F8CRS9_9BACT|nr:MAG: isoleucine--tRNA ligase [Candidatus Woesebacteria bacterium RIFOXYB1_FULL_38_16]